MENKHYASTVDTEEVERFSRIADEWWDEHGKFAPLHRINPLRIGYIRDLAIKHFRTQETNPLTGLSLIDIGCGGGLIAEPMARLGAQVTAIDASEKNIAVAKLHAERTGLTIDYRCTTAEALVSRATCDVQRENHGTQSTQHATRLFDIVLALEIIEHVADVESFVRASTKLVKPGGLLVYSTLNRTPKSYVLAIVGAEYVLRWLPRGTHTWGKFLKPSELAAHLRHNGMDIMEMTGMAMNPLTFQWRLDAKDLSVNYLVVGKK